MRANSEERVKAVLDVFQTKLVKRGISLKALDAGEPRPSGKEYRIEAGLKEGITQENAKKISKLIRDEGPKGVKAQIQGDELRVSAQEPRRPAGRHRAAQGRRLRRRAAVHQLPLTPVVPAEATDDDGGAEVLVRDGVRVEVRGGQDRRRWPAPGSRRDRGGGARRAAASRAPARPAAGRRRGRRRLRRERCAARGRAPRAA